MKDKQLLAIGIVVAAGFYLLRRSGSGVLPSSPLRLSNGDPLPPIGLPGGLFSKPLTLSNGQPLPYVIQVPFRPFGMGGDATVPNVAADGARATNTPTYSGWSGPGGTPNPDPSTWGVPDVGGLPQVGLVPAPETNADALAQARVEVVNTPTGPIDYQDSPSVTPDNARDLMLGFAPYALDLM